MKLFLLLAFLKQHFHIIESLETRAVFTLLPFCFHTDSFLGPEFSNPQTENVCMHAKLFQSSDSASLWTVAHQFSLSMGFSGQEYWSGLSCPSPANRKYTSFMLISMRKRIFTEVWGNHVQSDIIALQATYWENPKILIFCKRVIKSNQLTKSHNYAKTNTLQTPN